MDTDLKINKISNFLDLAIIYGICAYVTLMFFTKGEGIKNILLYGSFTLWLFTLKKSDIKQFLRNPTSKLFFIYVFVSILSVINSIDPIFSLNAMREVFIKGVVIFPILATKFNSEDSLKKLALAFTISASIMTFVGFYSYLFKDIPVLKPDVYFLHLWHNKFARYLNLLIPFIFVLFLYSKHKIYRLLTMGVIILSVLGLVLSTSRGGYAAFISIAFIWTLFLFKKKNKKLQNALFYLIFIFVITVAFIFIISPTLRERLTTVESFKERFNVWTTAFESFKERPLLGWGFGPKMVRREEPYTPTDYNPPLKGMHNTFFMIAFTQGIIGLISYLGLLLYSIIFCWKNANIKEANVFASLMFISILSILVGNYLVHSMLELVGFLELSIILGISVAAKNIFLPVKNNKIC